MEPLVLTIIGICFFVPAYIYGAYHILYVTKPLKPMYRVNDFLDMDDNVIDIPGRG